uniref:RING-type E3 ubiquitin transferase n=1 Tax=Leersia perrieri TaxID=77586 RepID=A0A0D9V440_9ORYZ
MARPRGPDDAYACLSLLLLILLPAVTATPYSSLCSSPAETADLVVTGHHHQSHDDDELHLPLPSEGYFSGGGDLHFASENYRFRRSFSFFTLRASRTTNPAIHHLVAVVTLSGYRLGRHTNGSYSVSFHLDGYYSTEPASASAVLCMVGSGSRARDDGFGVVVLPDVVLRLRLPRPANLTRPFVTGSLEGPDFGTVTLVAYAEGDYKYGEAASCPAPPLAGAVRSASQVLDAAGLLSCNRIKELLRGSYALEYPAAGRASNGFPPVLRRHRSMHVSQMYCAHDGAVRAHMVLDDMAWWRPDGFLFHAAGAEALVADGFWDTSRSRLCFKACRPVRSTVRKSDCGIGMQFWFPAVWSIHDRSVVAGMIWNTSDDDTNKMSRVISVSRTGFRGNFSDIKYNYTRVEDAKKYYYSKPELSKERKGRFPGNYSYRDFDIYFHMMRQGGSGYASPVTLGSAIVDDGDGGRLMADYAFARHAVPEMNEQRLLNVSYEFDFQYRYVESSRAGNVSFTYESWRISAEGIYDTKAGSLCMLGCRVINGSSDCEILVTLQFASLDGVDNEDGEHGFGSISSLRKNKTDPLFFETLGIAPSVMIALQAAEEVSRLDMERIMLVSSMTLSCVFLLLQLRHTKKNPDALQATSVTMLAVLSLGYMIPLVLNFEAMFADDGGGDRGRNFVLLASGTRRLELALRASTMVAFVLQLRLLQLAWSEKLTTGVLSQSRDKDQWAAERSTLWVCLPLYIAGAVLIWIHHISDGHADQPTIGRVEFVLDVAPRRAPLSGDLVSYAGLIMDGFLLPQIVCNALSGSRVNAISPWFYVGGTVIRAAPHVYDGLRTRGYVQRWMPSYVDVYASPRDGLFGVAWDVAIPCGAAALAVLLFFQQRLGGDFLCRVKSRKPGGYERVDLDAST